MNYKTLNFEEAWDIMNSDPSCIVLDVREDFEYATGHAANAVLFPIDDISEKSAAEILPDKNAAILIYCRTGSRSSEAANYLSSIGYVNIYDIGSLVDWPYGLEYGLD